MLKFLYCFMNINEACVSLRLGFVVLKIYGGQSKTMLRRLQQNIVLNLFSMYLFHSDFCFGDRYVIGAAPSAAVMSDIV